MDVGTKQVQRSAQALGEQVAGYERQTREPDSGLPLPSTLYLGLDGTGVPMRSTEVQGRAGKQPDGSARTREAKLCTVWSAERRDAQGRPQRDPHSVTYTAAIESAATLEYGPPAFGVRESESSAKANDAVLGKRHGKSSRETERGGSGISPASSSRRRCRLSIVFTPKSDSIRSRRVCMPTASPGRSGRKNVARNSMPVGSRPSCRSSPPRPLTTRREKGPAPISKSIDIVCVTRSSRPRDSAPQPGWWKPDAKTPSGHDSNVPGCIGVCGELIRSWPFGAFDSVDVLRTSGNGEPIPKPQLDPVVTFLSCTLSIPCR